MTFKGPFQPKLFYDSLKSIQHFLRKKSIRPGFYSMEKGTLRREQEQGLLTVIAVKKMHGEGCIFCPWH